MSTTERRLKFKFTDSSKFKPSKHEFDRSLRYIIIQFDCWRHVCLFSNVWLVCWMNERVCIFVCLMRPLWLIHHRFWYSIEYHILVDLRPNSEFYVNTFSSDFWCTLYINPLPYTFHHCHLLKSRIKCLFCRPSSSYLSN